MCKKNEPQVLITKEEFVGIINRLRELSDLVNKVDALFRISYFIYELDYGRDYELGCVTDSNGIRYKKYYGIELGRGFMFVGTQQRITINNIHYYADMVFYNKSFSRSGKDSESVA